MKSAATAVRRTVAVMADKGHPMAQSPPTIEGVDFVIGRADYLSTQPAAVNSDLLITFCVNSDHAKDMMSLFSAMPNLRWVHSFSTGVDAMKPFIETCLLEGRGADVPLSCGRGAFSSSLGEWVATSVLHFNKQLPRCVANRREKKWDRFEMDTVAGKTIGFVGFGDIAQCGARIMKGFGMRILAMRNDPSKGGEGLADEVFGNDQTEEMFGKCDFVVSVLPGTAATQNFFGKQQFAQMKPGSVFISVGRGVVVDEDALLEVLQNGHLKGAALDVFKVEPLPEDSPLWDQENLLLTAHNADITHDYVQLGWSVFEKNYHAWNNGEPLKTLVDKSQGY